MRRAEDRGSVRSSIRACSRSASEPSLHHAITYAEGELAATDFWTSKCDQVWHSSAEMEDTRTFASNRGLLSGLGGNHRPNAASPGYGQLARKPPFVHPRQGEDGESNSDEKATGCRFDCPNPCPDYAGRRAGGAPSSRSRASRQRTSCRELRDGSNPGVRSATALLHSFAYDEADISFADVAARDPACAMAYWGRAMTHYHQLWDVPAGAGSPPGSRTSIGRRRWRLAPRASAR